MFGKIFSRFQETKTEHPLGSDENLDALMADIPESDPGRLLFDVDEWLGSMESAVPEIGWEAALRAVLRLDQYSRRGVEQLLIRYLSVGKREYLADSVWSAIETHAGHLFQCYKASLCTSPDLTSDQDKTRMARCAARALRAWALRKKLQRFRYRTPSVELWQDAHDLLKVVGRLGLLQLRVVPYRDDTETTPLREYLIGLYLAFVPSGNLVPQQLEFAEGILRSCDGLELNPQPNRSSTDRIDLAEAKGPQRIREDDVGGSSVRYCSVLNLRGALMKLATEVKKPDEMPAWLAALPISREQIESGILILMTHWSPAPPKRGDDRIDQKADLKVVLGFGLARRMIAASHFARMGRSIEYEGEDVTRRFDEARFGMVGKQEPDVQEQAAQAPPAVHSPGEILRKLELGGNQAQMESWVQVDCSATGLGVVVPAVLPRHRIGLLICLRHADGVDWRLAVIRRIGRDAANRPSIGIETLDWPSICAVVKPLGTNSAWINTAEGGDGWSDAIIVSQGSRELILPAGTFKTAIELDVRSEEGLWRVRLESLLDRGPDYDRIEFTKIS